MSSQNPKHEYPLNHKPPGHQPVGFDSNKIPRFVNPNVVPKKPHKARGFQVSNLPPTKLHEHNKIHNESQKKASARVKLARIRKHRHFSTARFAVMSFIVFMVIFNFQVIYSQALYLFSSNTTSQDSSQSPNVTANPAQTAEAVGPENVIIIPKLNLNAPLVFIDTIEERAVLRALHDGVVHYSGTAKPGENGNSVFFGHSSNDLWERGNYKFVFALLERLAVGDQYEIHYQSRKYVYKVEQTKVVEPTDLSVLNQTSTPYSTLITCTPPGTSWRRFIVVAKQISPEPQQSTTSQTAQVVPESRVLPSAAPNIFAQIQIVLNDLWNSLFGGETTDPGSSSPTNNDQPQRLPEVSQDTFKMPTTF